MRGKIAKTFPESVVPPPLKTELINLIYDKMQA